MYKEIEGDLITLAQAGEFDVIAHGCNCFCRMESGLAPQMVKAFGADKFPAEALIHKGVINKLGTIDYKSLRVHPDGTYKDEINTTGHDKKMHQLIVVNAYTQYGTGEKPDGTRDKVLDYEALTLCLKKIDHYFRGLKVGLPMIGCGLAGGNEEVVKMLIRNNLKACNVTLVHYKPKI